MTKKGLPLPLLSPNPNLTFGDLVKNFREENGLVGSEFIKKLGSDVKISLTYLSNIERKGEIPGPQVVLRIADLIRIDRKYLIQIAIREKIKAYEDRLDSRYQQALKIKNVCR